MDNSNSESILREKIGKMMAEGLVTQIEPFPKDHSEFSAITREINKLDDDDLKQKLVISGFLDHPYSPFADEENEEPQRCLECMYYLVHRKWCDIPELSLPVEEDWWCRLWRI